MTTVLPAANAGASDLMVRMAGEFHGVITPTTPSGSYSTRDKAPGWISMARP
ncbi:hypothetical protein D3C73_1148230 [compost metagenome]